MVERRDREAVATFFSPESLSAGHVTTLGSFEARHAKVRRIDVGAGVRLVDGAGTVGWGQLVQLTKTQASVEVTSVDHVEPLPEIHLMVPVADRDRMLLLAEKATEMGAASWRPVIWHRSRGVSPRGEGIAFQSRARSRMISALTQCGGAWLPSIHPDATLARAIAACPTGTRWLLDADGDLPTIGRGSGPVTIAAGPEGGLEPQERDVLLQAGFEPVKLAPLTLRFETAAIAGMALARAAL
jgi:RNA methyltransferase, RsmE family